MSTPSELLEDPFQALDSRFDRRRRTRIPIHIPIRIFLPGAPRGAHHNGSCTNISEGGLAFETTAVLDLTTRIDIEFYQSGHPTFRRQVALLYRMGRHYGAYFTGYE